MGGKEKRIANVPAQMAATLPAFKKQRRSILLSIIIHDLAFMAV
jgi:hypothetical protein